MGQRDVVMAVSQTSRGNLNQQWWLILEYGVILRGVLGKGKATRWLNEKDRVQEHEGFECP